MKRCILFLIFAASMLFSSCGGSAGKVYTQHGAWEARLSRSKPLDNRIRSPFGGNGHFKVKNTSNTSGRFVKPKRRASFGFTKPRYSKITKRKSRENKKLTLPKTKAKPGPTKE